MRTLSIAGLLILLTGCQVVDEGNGQSEEITQLDIEKSPREIAKSQRPPDEIALFKISEQAIEEVPKAPNQFQANKLADRWVKKWCDALKSIGNFKNWTGILYHVENGRLTIEIDGPFYFVDVISPESGAFRQAAEMKEGGAVKISGRLIQDDLICGDWSDVGSRSQSVDLAAISAL